jgi:hypothetical protein
MSEQTVAEFHNIPAGMMPEPDLTDLPPKSMLPKAVHKAYDVRETAYERYVDFESEHYELLALSWEQTFAERDEQAGRQAIVDGADPLSVPSALEEAKAKRSRIVGALHALVAEVNKADQALCSAVRLELGPIGESIEAGLAEAAQVYADLQNAADQARQVYGAKLHARDWWTDWAKLGIRSHFNGADRATPLTVQGVEATDIYGNPVARGAAEVRAIDASYGAVVHKPKATIRAKNSGQELTIDASHAAALLNNGSAEFVSGEVRRIDGKWISDVIHSVGV